jgi:hypothetical protein
MSFKSAIRFNQRKNNLPTVSSFVNDNKLCLYSEPYYTYFSGSLNVPVESTFINEIILSLSRDISDEHNNCDFMESEAGVKIQIAKFKREYYLPIYRWFKNRNLYDSKLFTAIVLDSLSSDVSEILMELDKVKKYTMPNFHFIKYRLSS